MKDLILIASLLIAVGCSHADDKTEKTTQIINKEPYSISFSTEKLNEKLFKLIVTISPYNDSYFISPFSVGNYKGTYKLKLESTDKIRNMGKFIESPKAEETIDPFSKNPATPIFEKTSYTHSFNINSDEDFEASGFVQFVIEPKCTLEKIGFKITSKNGEISVSEIPFKAVKRQEPHKYGGWYCPDNLNGFPAVDLDNWKNVPVVTNRLPTKEETSSGKSLIFIDTEKHPEAKPINIQLPQLARYYNDYSKKEELIIVIQAVNVQNDSIVGFRYLNGGNGSAWLNEIEFLSKAERSLLAPRNFVNSEIEIDASAKQIWDIITNPTHTQKPNLFSASSEKIESKWENFYIQSDYSINGQNYVEKLILFESEDQSSTRFKIVAGPFYNDFSEKNKAWNNWLNEVKKFAEQ